MLGKDAILDAYDVGGDPAPGLPKARESSVHYDEIAAGDDRARLVFESRREALDQVHQPITARLNVGTVLNVFRRPEVLCSRVAEKRFPKSVLFCS